jgi:conjugative relaxase-like TrwC/TraI family protein
MAVLATIASGYDTAYMWANVAAEGDRRGAGYYLSAAEEGEPPGRWWGPAAEALSLRKGQEVQREPYELLLAERKGPDGQLLGRPVHNQGARQRYEAARDRLLAAEPAATETRRAELRIVAAQQARLSPLYMDLTISLSKSLSIFHASLGENARLARDRGDADEEKRWSTMVEDFDAAIYEATGAALAYFQREAGYTRTGSHARRTGSRETGQWHEADLAVAQWLQHTSRDGDMQLHVHNQIARISRTRIDGKWRAPDSLGYHEHIAAAGSIAAQHLEEALTRRFGLAWEPREDGRGYEIAGISKAMREVFSTRRESIDAKTRGAAQEFQARYGRAPSQRELGDIRQKMNLATRKGKEHGPIDWDAAHASWDARLCDRLGVSLASVAPSVWGHGTGGETAPRDPEPGGLPHVAMTRTAQKALELAAQEKAAWTRADLVKHLGRVLPRTGMRPADAAAVLEELADRALASQFEPVTCLEAPEAVEPPPALRRADGRSVYQRHGGTRYALQRQLAAESRLVAHARRDTAPRLAREDTAAALGASTQELDAALAGRASDARATQGPRGLRMDQAAVLFHALTSKRTAEVIIGPAGSGKTRTLAEAARIWQDAGLGRVIGLAPSQSSRDTLAAAGIAECYNTAQFLGHVPGQRGARGAVPVGPGALILADEASMISSDDFADVIAYAAARGAKLIPAGDHWQLQAVGTGGVLALLAEETGYAQLAEPVRFRQEWERDASLRFRQGDVSVLADYDTHGRIRGGEPELVMDEAARAYVALALHGKDVLLMVQANEHRREMSRRIQDELRSLGLADAARTVPVGEGLRAGAGDLVVCIQNDHSVVTDPGHELANRDMFRVERVTRSGLELRRVLDMNPLTGARRYAGASFETTRADCWELGYAVTCHVAQSRTVHTGIGLITGTEDRQHAYVAVSRGAASNLLYVLTPPPKQADPAPDSRPAPELGRAERQQRERQGGPPVTAAEPSRAATGVLADVLERDGSAQSAHQALENSILASDHLAVLYAPFQELATEARQSAYRDLLLAELPPQWREGAADSHQARWLWNTLRQAELTGLDPRTVLREAISASPLTGARDVASVIDARIRQRIAGMVPLPQQPWQDVPEGTRYPGYAAELATAMAARAERLGEHAAQAQPEWARGLGSVPADPLERLGWERRASAIAAYRELSGHDHPADPIGPEPAASRPDRRAAWHEAFIALGPADGPDVRGMPDGRLLLLRDSYRAETAWAPRFASTALRQLRLAAEDAEMSAVRGDAHAAAEHRQRDEQRATAHQEKAAAKRALAAAFRERETLLEATAKDRCEWEKITEQPRRLALAADSEFRRRHPEQKLEPLRSAEPEPVSDTTWQRDLSAEQAAFAERLAERQSVRVPSADPEEGDLGQAWPAWEAQRDAILQPPKPKLRTAGANASRHTERETESPEAGS